MTSVRLIVQITDKQTIRTGQLAVVPNVTDHHSLRQTSRSTESHSTQDRVIAAQICWQIHDDEQLKSLRIQEF